MADTDTVDAEQTRLAAAGLASIDERGTTCCYAKQDKFWVEGAPNGERWEVYTVLEDAEVMAPERDRRTTLLRLRLTPAGSPAPGTPWRSRAARSASPGR